ncbi:MAG TPA: peptidoglycan-binding protein [Xanthobacteraceae bacterium]|nr:peptidoglycan-binding protein [Xanthobacteraceae bacterium]
MRSSQDAFNLIVSEEVDGKIYYLRHCAHFEWPQGASGPTIMIGYDCGYVTRDEATADCRGILSDDMLPHVLLACGLKGEAAHQFVAQHGTSVTVTWDQALAEFSTREMPKWEARLDAALPTAKLTGDSYGALVSLAYNRGCSFDEPGPRYAEMRSIKAHMLAGRFDLIPDEFLSMRRLWLEGSDLWRRRGHEADLFRKGLGLAPLAPPRPEPVRRTTDRSVRALQTDLNQILQLDPPLAVDGVEGDKTRAAVRHFQEAYDIEADGVAGNKTWAVIEQILH